MRLVAEHADWWNVHTHIVDKLDEMRPLQVRPGVHFRRRWRTSPPRAPVTKSKHGTATFRNDADRRHRPELVDYFGSLQERGVERVYAWFCDFAAPDTLAAFGEDVIRQFDPTRPLT